MTKASVFLWAGIILIAGSIGLIAIRLVTASVTPWGMLAHAATLLLGAAMVISSLRQRRPQGPAVTRSRSNLGD